MGWAAPSRAECPGFGSGAAAHTDPDQFIEFTQIGSGGSFSYTSANAANTSGTLAVVSGGVSATVTLVGHYSAGDFASGTVDGHMKITDPPPAAQQRATIEDGGVVITFSNVDHPIAVISGTPPIVDYVDNVPVSVPDGGLLILPTPNTSTVTFAGSSGTLALDQPETFSGAVAGFAAQDRIDLLDIAFGAQTTLAYATNSGGTGGVLTITDGTQAAAIALLGNYMAASFVATSDGYGGTLVTAAQQQAEPQPLLTRPHPA